MLPQFTLNARIIFFMMVMFATATTASLKKTNDVVIMLKNHEKALHVNAGGKVTATDISLAQFFTMESVGDIFSDTFKIALYAKEVGRYLCFRKGKLVGMKNLTRDCHFIESLEHGYFLYANAYNPLWRVGFTRGLKPVGPRHWKRPQTLKRACFLFVKINAEHFDRSRFTTTTTTTAKPRLEIKKTQTDAGNLSGNYKLYDSKASIIDSNNNNYKKTKSANNGHRHRHELASESIKNTGLKRNRWPDKDVMEQRHRKRKHHVKLAASNNNSGSSVQPKNLVRHHHNHQGNGEGRRRQHEREEKDRKLRLQNQRRHNLDNIYTSSAEPNATNSASPSVAATTLAATASLAPSALNIVAMLAAGRRKRGRRKKQVETTTNSNISSSGTGQQAMDLQLVAQSPLQVQTQYDQAQSHSTQSRKHEHNYYQLQQQKTIAPVSSTSLPKIKVKVQQQNHKYSNSNSRDSQLYNSNSINHSRNISSSSRNSSSSLSSSSYSRSHILRRIKRSNLNGNTYHNYSHNINFNKSNNYYLYDNNKNTNNINNNNYIDKLNAIPALPKNNFNNNKYLMPTTTTRSSTDFKTNLQKFSHYIYKIPHHPTSYPFISNYNSNTSFLFSISGHATNGDIVTETHRLLDKDKKNSNNNINNSSNIYKNSNKLSDNNLQQESWVLNRFKPIYLNRIRNRRKSHKIQTNIKQKTYYKTNNYSPISSTIKQNDLNFQNVQNLNEKFSEYSKKNKNTTVAKYATTIANTANATATATTTPYIHIKNNYSHRYTNYNNNKVNDNKIYNDNAKLTNSIGNSKRNSSSSINSSTRNKTKTSTGSDIFDVFKYHHNEQIFKILKVERQKQNVENNLNILKFTTYTTNAYRQHTSRILSILGQQHKINFILTTTNTTNKNPNKYNYNNYNNIYNTNTKTNENENENNNNDNDTHTKNDDKKLKRIQNKYEKIIVQYRSVVN